MIVAARALGRIRTVLKNWDRPSNLGMHLTCAGIFLLGIALALNHIFPGDIEIDIDDWVMIALLGGYLIFHWATYFIGGALICVGCGRIFLIDSP